VGSPRVFGSRCWDLPVDFHRVALDLFGPQLCGRCSLRDRVAKQVRGFTQAVMIVVDAALTGVAQTRCAPLGL
jgi:hypothetical protein